MIDENLKIKEELADLRISHNELVAHLENVQTALEQEKDQNRKLLELEEIARRKIESLNAELSKQTYKANQMERENKNLREEFYETNLNTTQHSEMVITEYKL